jgi:hypothetical protein
MEYMTYSKYKKEYEAYKIAKDKADRLRPPDVFSSRVKNTEGKEIGDLEFHTAEGNFIFKFPGYGNNVIPGEALESVHLILGTWISEEPAWTL